MHTDLVFLTELNAMWADMLMQILQDNGISATDSPVQGTRPAIYSGQPKGVKIFVPADMKSQAEEIVKAYLGEQNQ